MPIAIFQLAVCVLMIVASWKVFVKAGQPGWACIVPFYNMYIMSVKMAGLEIMWFIFLFIPILNIVAIFKIYIALAKNFGKTAGFGVGMVFLGIIFFPILAFSDAKFSGEAAPAVPAE
jgi:hypothetical protein